MNSVEVESGDVKLGEIVDELLTKLARGEHVDVEQYAQQHPAAADVLRHAIPALQAVARSSSGGDRSMATTLKTSAEAASDEFASGRTLGDFRLVGELGRGGMGVVYEADEISLGRKVALKILPFAGIVDDRALQRFRNEVRAAAALDHPNIVSVLSAGEQRGVHYYAMQLVRGQTLAEVIHELSKMRSGAVALSGDSISRIVSLPSKAIATSGTEPTGDLAQPAASLATEDTRPVDQHRQQTLVASTNGFDPQFFRSVAILCMQAANALQHAHDNGVLHRDIKPGNLMLDAQSQLYVTDFGLARIETDAAMTMTGDLIGTLRYMSPEQALAKRVVIDQRSDIYSLGATFYEMLSLRPVFTSSDRQALLKQIAFEEPIKLRKIVRTLPLDLETIMHKSLAKNPEERYTTAEEFAVDLQAFIDHRPITARPPTPLQRLGKWSQRNRVLVASGAVAAAVCIVLLVVSNILVARQKALAVQAAASETVQRQNAERERDAAEQSRKQAEDVADFMIDAFRSPDPEKDGHTITVVEVLDQAVKELESRENIGPIRRANLLAALGSTYGGLELGREAVPLLEQVRTLRQEQLGGQHADTLRAMNNLAVAYSLAGRTKDAFALKKETLDMQRQVLGERHRDTLRSMGHLAGSYKDLGRIEEALQLHEKTLKIKREVLGDKDPQTLVSMHSLALAYENAGRSTEALELMKETYELRCEVLGQRDRRTLQSMGMLGLVFLSVGEPKKAVEIVEQSQKFLREALGDQHPTILTGENNLAVAYSALGRHDDALEIHEKILKLSRTIRGERHPSTLSSMLNASYAYSKAGRDQEALELAKKTLKLCREVHGERHQVTFYAMNALATAYKNLNRYPEIIELCETLLKLRREELGDRHPDTLTSMANLAFAYELQGRYAEAIELGEQALELRRNILGERHPGTLSTMTNLALIYERAARYSEAVELQKSSLELCRDVLGERHPQTISGMKLLADRFSHAGQHTEAVEQYTKVLDVLDENDSENKPSVLAAKNGLANAYSGAGRFTDALELREQLLKQTREMNGDRHPNTLVGVLNLADSYKQADRFQEALVLYDDTRNKMSEILGPWHRLTLISIKTRLRAYHSAGRYAEASQLQEEEIDFLKNPPAEAKLDRDAIARHYAGVLCTSAKTEIKLNHFEKAESRARESLELLERLLPDHLTRFWTQTILGEALLRQAKLDEAEQHLLDGFAGMESRKESMDEKSRERLPEVCQLLVDLYQQKEDALKAEKWEQTLVEWLQKVDVSGSRAEVAK